MIRSYRALAVEDDSDSLELIRLVLKPLPLSLDHVTTGAEAMDYLAVSTPDLLLLDIQLPDMRGWEVLDHFRGDQRLSGVRVIVLTAHGEPVNRLIGLFQPVTAFIQKPVEAEALRDQVRRILSL